MTPKEKADEIVNGLFERTLAYHDACIAAKMLADEMIVELQDIITDFKYMRPSDTQYQRQDERIIYWKNVKQEIEKL